MLRFIASGLFIAVLTGGAIAAEPQRSIEPAWPNCAHFSLTFNYGRLTIICDDTAIEEWPRRDLRPAPPPQLPERPRSMEQVEGHVWLLSAEL
ncbi:MAG TPA: hypothetical protein VGU20_09905 [Stellaceae bacterium]|nr:hypothetical protein [Stellaceae bacterium]